MKTFKILSIWFNKLSGPLFAVFSLFMLTACPYIVEVKTDDTVVAGETMKMPVLISSDGYYSSWFTMNLLLPDGWTVKNDSISFDDGFSQFVVRIMDNGGTPYSAPEGYYWWSGMASDITIEDNMLLEPIIELETGIEAGIFELALFLDYDCSGTGPCRLDSERFIRVETVSNNRQPFRITGQQDDESLILNWEPPHEVEDIVGYVIFEDEKSSPVSKVIKSTMYTYQSPQKGIHSYSVGAVSANGDVFKSNQVTVFFGENLWISSDGSDSNDGANELEAIASLDYALNSINPDEQHPVTLKIGYDTLRITNEYGEAYYLKDHLRMEGLGPGSVIDLVAVEGYIPFYMQTLNDVSFSDLSFVNAGTIFRAERSTIDFYRVNFFNNLVMGEINNSVINFYNVLVEKSGLNSAYYSTINYINSVIIFDESSDFMHYSSRVEKLFLNSILWGSDEISSNLYSEGLISFEYSAVQGGYGASALPHPEFDHNAAPYSLGSGSACIDAGNPDEAYFDAENGAYQGSRINDLGIYGGPYARRGNLILSTEEEDLFNQNSLANYPNPAKAQTTIQYTLANSQQTKLELIYPDGRQRELLVDEIMSAGTHELQLDADSLSPGLYLVSLSTASQRNVHRMVVR